MLVVIIIKYKHKAGPWVGMSHSFPCLLRINWNEIYTQVFWRIMFKFAGYVIIKIIISLSSSCIVQTFGKFYFIDTHLFWDKVSLCSLVGPGNHYLTRLVSNSEKSAGCCWDERHVSPHQICILKCVPVCQYMHVNTVLSEVSRGRWIPGAGVAGSCELPVMGVGNWNLGPLSKAVCAFSCWAIFPSPLWSHFLRKGFSM